MNKAPGPKGSLFLGSLRAFQANPLQCLLDASRDHGDIARFRFAHITAHLLNHPDHVTHVLSRHADKYDKNTRSASRIAATCGESLLSGSTDVWQRHRTIIQPVFQPAVLQNLEPLIDARLDPVLDRWSRAATTGTALNITQEMMALAISATISVLFSSNVKPEKIETPLEVILTDTWRRIEAPFDLSQLSPRLHRKSFRDALRSVDDIVLQLIQDHDHKADDVLSRLLGAAKNDTDGLTKKELRDAAVTLLLAGHETTATAMAWVFRLASGQYETTDPALLFAEAIRLYPSIWVIERRAVAADEIAG